MWFVVVEGHGVGGGERSGGGERFGGGRRGQPDAATGAARDAGAGRVVRTARWVATTRRVRISMMTPTTTIVASTAIRPPIRLGHAPIFDGAAPARCDSGRKHSPPPAASLEEPAY